MSTTTSPPADLDPEIVAARTGLAQIPPDWVTEALTASVLRRAALQAAARKLGDRVNTAQVAASNAVAAVAAGDVTDTALQTLTDTHTAVVALETARTVLPAPTLDTAACEAAVERAGREVAVHRPVPPAKPAYTDEVERWRAYCQSSGRVVDPPVATDADRAAEAKWRPVQDQVEQWQTAVAGWNSLRHRPGAVDILPQIGAAAAYLESAAALVPVIDAVNATTTAADNARRAAGLNWSPA
ncbi:hypothetical protein GALL_341420 [mine drainage metagenome]|uniref:Uncharacterized protein n=1 Tax=mine drainage metagenome TaxID=410659 RepID=A0A1J5QKN2_9ZZZZ